jgi:DNA-binding transcriptional ArsR family regulator
MQALLLTLGLSATDPSQLCELPIGLLAERTRQSRRSVSRLLAELEQMGVIERDDRYVAYGDRKLIVRLRLDREVRLLTLTERNAMPASHGVEDAASDDPKDAETSETGRANPAERSCQSCREVMPKATTGRANPASPPLYTNLEESLSNASASAREGEREKFIEFQKRLRDDQKRFVANYPGIAGMDLERVEQELGRLNLGDRDIAIREAAHYAAEFKASKKTFPKEAWRWIAARDFDRLAEVRQAKAEKAGLKAPLVPVRKGTRAGDTWEASDRRTGKKGYWTWSDEHRCLVSWRPTLFPPESAAAAALEAEPAAPAPRVAADAWKTLAARINPQPVNPDPDPVEGTAGPPDDEIPFE